MAEDIPKLPSKIEIDQNWYAKRDEIVQRSKELANGLSSQGEWETAEWYLTQITKQEKELEKQRKAISKPFNDVAKRVKKIADDAFDPLKERKDQIKAAMKKYNETIEEARQKEIDQQAQKAQESDNPFAAELAKAEEPETKKPQQTTTKMVTVTKFEIKNSNQVPREYCRPDERLIREAVQKNKVTEIPGVEIWTEQEPRSK